MVLKPIGFLLKLMSLAGVCLAAGVVCAGTISAQISPQFQTQAKIPTATLPKPQKQSTAAPNPSSLKSADQKLNQKLPLKKAPSKVLKKSSFQTVVVSPAATAAQTTAVFPTSSDLNFAKTSTLAITQMQTEPRLSGSSSSRADYAELKKQDASGVEKQQNKPISGVLNLSYSQSLVDHQDGTVKNSRGALAVLKGNVSENWSLLGRLAAEEDMKDPESIDNGISDLLLILSNKERPLTPWLTGTWTVLTALPTSERSQKVDQLKATVGTGYKFGLAEAIMPAGLSTTLGFTVAKNIHQYETSTGGEVLNSHSLKETLNTDYSYKQWSLSLEFIHRHIWNYANSISENFEHTEEVGFAILPAWKVSLGHTNAGSWLKSNTQDLNLGLYNEDDSIVYGSTELTF